MFIGLLVLGTPAFFRERSEDETACKDRQWHRLFPALTLLNIGGEAAGQLCIATAGSGTYIVLYSSMTVFTVAFRRGFLKRSATWPMLAGIVVIVAGLAMTIGGVSVSPGQGQGRTSSTAFGVIAGLTSALLYAAYYTTGEYVLCAPVSPQTPLVSPWAMGAFEGYFFTVLYIPYAVFLLFNGHWETMVAKPMENAHADGNVVASCYLILILVNGLHLIALLKLLRHTDAIVAGINKAVQVRTSACVPACFSSLPTLAR
jgi:drug/metabolite transporter (DMT)-like permease